MAYNLIIRAVPARAATAHHIPKLSARTTARFFSSNAARHNQPAAFSSSFSFTSRTPSSTLVRSPARKPLSPAAPRRGYHDGRNQYPVAAAAAQAQAGSSASLGRRLLLGGAVFGGTLLAVNALWNRETRDDGGMPPYERAYLNETFLHTGLGVGIIGLAARQFLVTGFTYRLMATNPWVVAIGGLAAGIGTMMATRSIDPDK